MCRHRHRDERPAQTSARGVRRRLRGHVLGTGAAFSPDAFDTASCELPTPAAGRKGIWDDYIIDISKRKAATESPLRGPAMRKRQQRRSPSRLPSRSSCSADQPPADVVLASCLHPGPSSSTSAAVSPSSTTGTRSTVDSSTAAANRTPRCRRRSSPGTLCSHSRGILPCFCLSRWCRPSIWPALATSRRALSAPDPASSRGLRDRACSDLALLIGAIQSTAFNHQEPTFQYVRDSGGNLLLTEPWSEILVHSITTVVKTEVKLHEGYCSLFKWKELEESHARIERCLWALEQLSDRSPSAHMAHEQLEKLTNARDRATSLSRRFRWPVRRWRGTCAQCGPRKAQVRAAMRTATAHRASAARSRGAEVSPMGFDGVQAEGSSLESALHSYFTANLG
ncbi:hypothetical protein L1887_50717 [Cichorium endivia]|nr:hypothetical protein L1887_50717 [Cichorium endivia]